MCVDISTSYPGPVGGRLEAAAHHVGEDKVVLGGEGHGQAALPVPVLIWGTLKLVLKPFSITIDTEQLVSVAWSRHQWLAAAQQRGVEKARYQVVRLVPPSALSDHLSAFWYLQSHQDVVIVARRTDKVNRL